MKDEWPICLVELQEHTSPDGGRVRSQDSTCFVKKYREKTCHFTKRNYEKIQQIPVQLVHMPLNKKKKEGQKSNFPTSNPFISNTTEI